MRYFTLSLIFVLMISGVMTQGGSVAAAQESLQKSEEEVAGEEGVKGKMMGTEVNLKNAKFSRQLELFEGDSWGSNPSILVFLFLKDSSKIPEGQVFRVGADDKPDFKKTTPHIHYRWRNPETDGIDVEMVTKKYNLSLEFGKVKDGYLPGTIEFEVPDKETHVKGKFRAKVKQ